MKKEKKKCNKFIKYSIISFSVMLIIYFSMSMYFRNHFYFGSVINGINATGKTAEELDKEASAKITSYTLELEERGNVKEQIKASEIGLKYDGNGKSQELKEEQNSSPWISSLFKSKESKMYKAVTFDEAKLKDCFDKLACFDSKKVIEPKNASVIYSEGSYQIVKEVYGNKVKKDVLYSRVVNAIQSGETKLNLDSAECYENPKYISNSQKTKDTKNSLDKYVSSKITYTYNGGSEVLDGSTIHNWLSTDSDLAISFDQAKMRSYVNKLARNYNTLGKKRNFATTLGTTVVVSGGNYGWKVNVNGEIQDLISIIKKGQTINKEPKYSQTAETNNVNDIGNTYVEINLAEQHLWFYKNGSLVVDGDVVTGNVSMNYSTPTGVYRINYKEKDATLKGEDYSQPVTYWMPFNGNIGIHDASWRKAFGGDIYLSRGSHGCVNAPKNVANTVFNNITAGTPVVCYYQQVSKQVDKQTNQQTDQQVNQKTNQ
ncbi:MAG: L,D-transpeptidase/peptidoglycan binding protein [Bacillota bacterium]|nr:L,D-transpeptidase/peptidoglycan binding protein [Bacillota bacterium]